MKTKRFLNGNLLLTATAAIALLVACEPSTPTTGEPGTVGEISVSRTEIYEDQPTTFSATYVPSKDLNAEQSKFYVEFFNNGQPAILHATVDPVVKDGKAYVTLNTFESGNYEVKFNFLEVYKNNTSNTLTKTTTFKVKDIDTDFRNSMWYSSQDICLQDINFYYYEGLTVVENGFYFLENHFSNHSDTPNDKSVSYLFTGDKLDKVDYYLVQTKESAEGFISFMNRNLHSIVEKYDLEPITYDVPYEKDLTPEEQELVRAYKNGTLKKEITGTLVKAIQEGRLKLSATGKNLHTVMKMEIGQRVDHVSPDVFIRFTPAQ